MISLSLITYLIVLLNVRFDVNLPVKKRLLFFFDQNVNPKVIALTELFQCIDNEKQQTYSLIRRTFLEKTSHSGKKNCLLFPFLSFPVTKGKYMRVAGESFICMKAHVDKAGRRKTCWSLNESISLAVNKSYFHSFCQIFVMQINISTFFFLRKGRKQTFFSCDGNDRASIVTHWSNGIWCTISTGPVLIEIFLF